MLEELRIRALVQGVLVLRGQGMVGGGLSYQLWRDVIRKLLLMSDVSDLTISVLSFLVPDIETLTGKPILPAPKLDPQATQQRLYNTISELFKQSPQPILLLLEDLQWTTKSLQPLRTLNHFVAELPGNRNIEIIHNFSLLFPSSEYI